MELKNKFEEYTEEEFTTLVKKIFVAEGTEAYANNLILNFIKVSEHPKRSDLIFYPEDKNITPEGVVAQVKAWRKANGKPGFKAS